MIRITVKYVRAAKKVPKSPLTLRALLGIGRRVGLRLAKFGTTDSPILRSAAY
jgi:hypothetical protein